MKKMKSLMMLAISSVLAISVLAGCGTANKDQASQGGQAPAQKQKLVMGTSADYPPYEFHDTSSGKDEIKGFDIDIANYIANEMGFELEIKDSDFSGLIPALQSKRVDFVMAGMTPTDERKQSVDFSEMYYDAKNTIVAAKGSGLTTTDMLTGKKVGVQLGSIQHDEAKKLAETVQGLQVVPLNKIGDIIQEIKSNRVDAAIIEDTVAKGYAASNPDIEFNTIPSNGENGSAVAFPKGSTHVEDFNKAIKKLKDSGEMDKLVKKWFEKQ